MATYRKYGYSHGPKVILTAKVANTGAIAEGDIVVLDAVDAVAGTSGAGYIKSWSAASDPVVGVALEAASTSTSDGDLSVQVVLALPGTVFCFKDASVTQAYCFQCCDIGAVQTIDFDADTYQNVWIVEVDTERDLIYVMLKGPFKAADGVSSTIDYGSS